MSTAAFIGTYDSSGYPQAYLNDIPARNLTADDWAALTPDQQAEVNAAATLYVVTP